MNKFLMMMPRNLGNICFGSWLIGMGLIHSGMLGAALITPLNFVMGVLLVATGVLTLLGR